VLDKDRKSPHLTPLTKNGYHLFNINCKKYNLYDGWNPGGGAKDRVVLNGPVIIMPYSSGLANIKITPLGKTLIVGYIY